jgi:hypothetical protein
MYEKVLDWTQYIPCNRLCKSLTSLRLFVPSTFKIPWSMKKLWMEHKIYHITNSVNLWHISVTLTLDVGVLVLCMTYRLIIVTICAKLFQNPLNYEDWTQNIPFNRLCLFFTSKRDLDLEGRETGVAHDTSSYNSDYLCQVFSKSFDL